MNYKIELDPTNKIIKVNIFCELSQNIRKQILLSVVEQIDLTGFKKILIDTRRSKFDQDELMTGAVDLTNFFKTIGISPKVKFAFIYSEAERHRKYFENIAQLGGFNLRYFRAVGEALEWLK